MPLGYTIPEARLELLRRHELEKLCERRNLDTEGSREALLERLRVDLAAKMAKAYGRELGISWKKSVELARELRGKTVEDALEYLDNVIALKQAVPMRRYNRWVAHKAGHGPARYPVKCARGFRKVLAGAAANAAGEGEAMRIRVLNAHKGSIQKGSRPRAMGRSSPWNKDTVNLEIVLEEVG